MKWDLAWLSASSVLAILIALGCGGATQTALDGNSSNDAGSSSSTAGADGGFAITPGTIGQIIGSMSPDAGSGPVATDGGSTAVPSTPQVADGCSRLCTKEMGAACSAGGTLDSCLTGCRVILANPNCASVAQSLFSCMTTATASCDVSGHVVFDRCQVEQLNASACFLQNVNDPVLMAPCATYCAGVAAANCPNDTPAGCQPGCQVIGNLVAGCGTPWKNYVACANGSALSCGTNGKAGAPACTSQALTFFACAAGGLATILSDGGR